MVLRLLPAGGGGRGVPGSLPNVAMGMLCFLSCLAAMYAVCSAPCLRGPIVVLRS